MRLSFKKWNNVSEKLSEKYCLSSFLIISKNLKIAYLTMFKWDFQQKILSCLTDFVLLLTIPSCLIAIVNKFCPCLNHKIEPKANETSSQMWRVVWNYPSEDEGLNLLISMMMVVRQFILLFELGKVESCRRGSMTERERVCICKRGWD